MTGRSIAAAALAALAWGIFCWWGEGHSSMFVRGAAGLAGPWLLLAFWAGSQTRWLGTGAGLGALAVVVALLGYYLAVELLGTGGVSSRVTWDGLTRWALVAVPAGLGLGALGAAWRARGDWLQVAAAGILSAALLAEALLLFVGDRVVDLPYVLIPIAELTLAMALPVALLDRREAIRGLVVAGLTGPLAFVLQESLVRTVRDSLA